MKQHFLKNQKQLLYLQFNNLTNHMAKNTTKNNIENVPTKLAISKSDFNLKLENRIEEGDEILERKIQTVHDFEKLKKDFSDWNDYNSELLKSVFNVEFNEYKKRYDDAGMFNFTIINRRQVKTLNQELIDFKKRINSKLDNLAKLRQKSELLKSVEEYDKSSSPKEDNFSKESVFIVHGHDDTATTKTARFVEKLGFKAIILHEQSSGSKTVIEKIEAYSDVGFGIVLYTPCDTGGKIQDPLDLKNRARQNVVFEHGFLIGKIGRKNVCALVKGEVETPNDISGVVYVKMDDADAWEIKVAKELKNAGYNVDMNKL